jgi:hypothetical protein
LGIKRFDQTTKPTRSLDATLIGGKRKAKVQITLDFAQDLFIQFSRGMNGAKSLTLEHFTVTIKIIGAGFGRTATKSLKAALEQLGFGPCYHMIELHQNPERLSYWQEAAATGGTDWNALFEGYNACVDWPAAHYWRELAEFYPNAKILLSVRSAESWVKSIQSTIFKSLRTYPDMPPGIHRDRSVMNYEIIAKRTFDERLDDTDYLITAFNNHTAEVQRSIAPERLLTYDGAQGWEPLSKFLDVAIPDEPYPFTNTTADFQERAQERARELTGTTGSIN